jgi:hypothetical protein
MPRIPQRQIAKESHIPSIRLASSRLVSKQVGRAQPTRAIDTGESLLARGLGSVAELLGEKAETMRVAKSQNIQMGMHDAFRKLKVENSRRTSDAASGMLEELSNNEEKLRRLGIPKGLDARTTTELNQKFNQLYTNHATWTAGWIIKQSGIADNEATLRSIQNAHSNISFLGIGDMVGIDREVNVALNFSVERNPNFTENQIETTRRAFKEDFLNFAIPKWISDSPMAAVSFWDDNKKELKKSLPKTYNQLDSKIHVARDDARFDRAYGVLKRMYADDYSGMADALEKNPAQFFGEEGHADAALNLSTKLRSINNSNIVKTERIRVKKEEDFLMSNHEKHFNTETGITDVENAMIDLEQARRDEKVDYNTYNRMSDRLAKGGIFSSEDSNTLFSAINDGIVTTKGQVLKAIQGTNARPEPYYQQLSKRQKQIGDGLVDNWYTEAYKRFTNLSKIKDKGDLPSGLKEKELLVDILQLPDYKKKLESEARRLGYAAGDSRIDDLAKEILVGGWYSKTRPEFHPGEAPWTVLGEKYLRLWEYDPRVLLSEEEIEFLPESEAATGGNVELQELMKSPEGQTAYRRLLQEEIRPTEATLKQAMQIILEEERE